MFKAGINTRLGQRWKLRLREAKWPAQGGPQPSDFLVQKPPFMLTANTSPRNELSGAKRSAPAHSPIKRPVGAISTLRSLPAASRTRCSPHPGLRLGHAGRHAQAEASQRRTAGHTGPGAPSEKHPEAFLFLRQTSEEAVRIPQNDSHLLLTQILYFTLTCPLCHIFAPHKSSYVCPTINGVSS